MNKIDALINTLLTKAAKWYVKASQADKVGVDSSSLSRLGRSYERQAKIAQLIQEQAEDHPEDAILRSASVNDLIAVALEAKEALP